MSTVARPHKTSVLADLGIARAAAVGSLIVLALVLQSTVFAQATLLGVIPQLALVLVVCLAYLEGERVGVVAGFSAGLLQDLLLPQSIVGLTALVFTLVAYAVGLLRQYSASESMWTPLLAVALGSAVAEVGYALLAVILGEAWVSTAFTLKVVALVVLYDSLLTPLLFPLIKRVSERFRPGKVYRW